MTGSSPAERPADDLDHRLLDAQLHLLDRQTLDVGGQPVCVVDDVELSDPASTGDDDLPTGTPPPTILSLLSGPVLGTRIFGGRPPDSQMHRVPWGVVARIGVALELSLRGDALDLTWTERWVRDHLIGRIPGGRHDPE